MADGRERRLSVRETSAPTLSGLHFWTRGGPPVTTSLKKPIAREIEHGGATYKVTLSPDGIRVTLKGGRRG